MTTLLTYEIRIETADQIKDFKIQERNIMMAIDKAFEEYEITPDFCIKLLAKEY